MRVVDFLTGCDLNGDVGGSPARALNLSKWSGTDCAALPQPEAQGPGPPRPKGGEQGAAERRPGPDGEAVRRRGEQERAATAVSARKLDEAAEQAALGRVAAEVLQVTQKARLEKGLSQAELAELAELAKLVGMEEIRQDAMMCKRAIAGGAVATPSPRVDTLKSKEFGGKRDAKELDNFIWYMEQYFEGASIVDEKAKNEKAAVSKERYLVQEKTSLGGKQDKAKRHAR
ncbi:hypothetical protein RJ639_019043 [Escallonia herrerae]|uniref:Uncharacterized protein n=1 Tax=Escallonia herrerae TaxID=1293975 RepID=A0AA88VBL1_9ASTE|nr:hypothetical protein RJ639_019043 [Escallonia herrerae]